MINMYDSQVNEGQDAQEMGEEDMSSIHDVEGNKSKIMNLNWIGEIE